MRKKLFNINFLQFEIFIQYSLDEGENSTILSQIVIDSCLPFKKLRYSVLQIKLAYKSLKNIIGIEKKLRKEIPPIIFFVYI